MHGLPCPPGIECENTKCLTVGGRASCCTCISWDLVGACEEWQSNGEDAGNCNFDVDMYHMTMTDKKTLGDDSCPVGVSCEDEKCVEVGGQTECCMCTRWEGNGDCKPDGWKGVNGGECSLNPSGSGTPISRDLEMGGCPPRVSCEDRKCRSHNGSNTCCRCHRWLPSGLCQSNGWLRESGQASCDFSGSNEPVVITKPHYSLYQPHNHFRVEDGPAASLDTSIENQEVPQESIGENNAGNGSSQPDESDPGNPSTENPDAEQGMGEPVQPPSAESSPTPSSSVVEKNQEINPSMPGMDDNGKEETPAGPMGEENPQGDSSQDHMQGEPHNLRKLLVDRKRACKMHIACGMHVSCETIQCYGMADQQACCECTCWNDHGKCVEWKSNGKQCNFVVV